MARRIIRAWLALAVLVVMTAPASADPISIGTFIISSFLVETGIAGALGLTATSFVTLTAASQFILSAILTGAAYLFGQSGGGKIDPGKAKDTFTATDASEIRALGRVRLGGVIAFGSTNLTNRYRLVLHARKLDGVEDHFLGGFEVVRNSSGVVLSKPYVISGTQYIHLKTDLGDEAKTAWADLVSAFPALWTSNHRARGIAQTLVRYISPGLTSSRFLRLYQNGVPEYQVVARGEPVFDPRLAGSPGQDVNDPSTFAWSDNGILCALHVAVSFTNLEYADFDLDQIADAADDADATVTTLTGSEPRARCWGVWASEGNQSDTLAQLLQSIGAELFTTDNGLIGIRLVDDDRATDVTLSGDHLTSLDLRSGPESVERPNTLRLRYYSPERRYEMTEIDLSGVDWARVDSEVANIGVQIIDIDLPFCPSAAQAQRIGRRLFAYARADRGVAVFNQVGMAAYGARVVDIDVEALDETLHCAILPPRASPSDATVEVPFIVIPELPTWDYSTMEAPAPTDTPEITYAGAADKPATPSLAVVVQKLDASYETRVALSIGTGGGFSGGTASSEVVYRTRTPLPSEWRQMTAVTNNSVQIGYVAGLDLRTLLSDFRLRTYNTDDENTEWSDHLSTTPVIDNTAPAAPGIVWNPGVDIVVTAPSSLRVSYVRVTPPVGSPTNYTLRPGESVSIPTPANGTWSATANSSNGTASSSASVLVF